MDRGNPDRTHKNSKGLGGDCDGNRNAEDWYRRRWRRRGLGAHFCLFYETKEDLLEALISYCKSGLESDEYCLWIVAELLTVDRAPRLVARLLIDT